MENNLTNDRTNKNIPSLGLQGDILWQKDFSLNKRKMIWNKSKYME
jgi:hypothetical protein